MVKEGLQDTDSSCTGSGTGWELQGAHSTVTASRAAATATSWVKSNLANIFSWPLKAMGQTTRFTLENKWSLFELWFPGVELVLLISTIIFCIWTNTHTHTKSICFLLLLLLLCGSGRAKGFAAQIPLTCSWKRRLQNMAGQGEMVSNQKRGDLGCI